jgi:hypothetical protein
LVIKLKINKKIKLFKRHTTAVFDIDTRVGFLNKHEPRVIRSKTYSRIYKGFTKTRWRKAVNEGGEGNRNHSLRLRQQMVSKEH